MCQVKGVKSHEVVKQGLTVLKRLTHRGAQGADPKTGDGAGVLIQVPDKFFRAEAEGIKLPALGSYAVGMVFLIFPRKSGHNEELVAV